MVGRLLVGHKMVRQAWAENKTGQMPSWVGYRRELLLWEESRKGQVQGVHKREEELLWAIHKRVWQPLVVRRRNWVSTLGLHKTKTERTW